MRIAVGRKIIFILAVASPHYRNKIRSFKEIVSRMFSKTFGSIRSLGMKRSGSDLMFHVPRYAFEVVSFINRVNSSWPHCGLCNKKLTLEQEIFM